jgi:hypothetical protein
MWYNTNNMFQIKKQDRDIVVNFLANIDGPVTPKQAIGIIQLLNNLEPVVAPVVEPITPKV